MEHRPTSPTGDLRSALLYMVASAGIVALMVATYDVARDAMPQTLLGAMPSVETSGSGAQEEPSGDSRSAAWRITQQEAQKRFATRSMTLFPPTPAYRTPANWSPPYATMAKKQARADRAEPRAQASARERSRARGPEATSAQMPTPQNSPVPHAMIDAQMDGR
jgi:hypothetical protein